MSRCPASPIEAAAIAIQLHQDLASRRRDGTLDLSPAANRALQNRSFPWFLRSALPVRFVFQGPTYLPIM